MEFPISAVDPVELRRGHSLKWRKYAEDVLPLWVADMDFPPAESVTRAMADLLETGFLGYPNDELDKQYVAALRGHLARHFGIEVEPGNVVTVTDLVQAMRAAILAYSGPGDTVALLSPAYPPFYAAIADTSRVPLGFPLEATADGFTFDIESLEEELSSGRVRVFLLCNPHNPTGYVLRPEEVDRIVDACARNDVTLVSDEVHADFVYDPLKHFGASRSRHGKKARLVTLYSSTKAFNLAGIRSAVMILHSDELRREFDAVFPARLLGTVSSLSRVASIAAWNESDQWLKRVREQLVANRKILGEWIRSNDHLVHGAVPQSTYFQWLYYEIPSGWTGTAAEFILNRNRVALSDGVDFGADRHWVRLNFATDVTTLNEALDRIASTSSI
jgi:cystathionine beta-lyase